MSEFNEQTDAMPGAPFEGSLSLRVNRAATAGHVELWPKSEEGNPDLVVFEPTTDGAIADRLMQLGYPVRMAVTGVDVMSLVAGAPTSAVVVGPTADGEQRRLLCAAVQLRFPGVPIVYVSEHASQPRGAEGAKREGAHAIISWPLPAAAQLVDELDAVVGPGVREGADEVTHPPRGGVPMASGPSAPAAGLPEDTQVDGGSSSGGRGGSQEAFAVAPTVRFESDTLVDAGPPRKRQPRVLPHGVEQPFVNDDESATIKVAALVEPPPSILGARAGADVVRAIRPFLWGLRDASAYLAQESKGVGRGAAHAKTLSALADLLDQLED